MLDKLRSYRTLLAATFAITTICVLHSSTYTASWSSLSADAYWPKFINSTVHVDSLTEAPRPRLNVAVAEFMGHHDEVLGSVLHALSSMPDVDATLYRDRWRWEFDEVIYHFWDKPSIPQNQLLTDLAANESVSLVVLVSCDSSISRLGSELLRIWDERSTKFRLGCMVHHAWNIQGNDFQIYRELIQRDAIDFYTLSPHVSASVKQHYKAAPGWTTQGNAENTTLSASVDFVVPIFPLSDPAPRLGTRRLSRVLIQGNIEPSRRAYKQTFADLEAEMRADPDLFGYTLEQEDSGPTFRPIESVRDRFQLVLLGQDRGAVEIPLTLSHVVEVVPSAMYPEFYEAFDTCDLLIPAFNGNDYANRLASSSIGAAGIAALPIMMDAKLLKAYGHLDERVVVLRPDHMSEMKTVANFRRGNPDVWMKPLRGVREFQQESLQHNMQVFRDSFDRSLTMPSLDPV